MQIEIKGQDAVKAAEELLSIKGLDGSYETVSEEEKEGTLATIATIVGITVGTMTIAEKLYHLKKKYFQSPTGPKIEAVAFIYGNGNLLLLKDATKEQIQEVLEGLK